VWKFPLAEKNVVEYDKLRYRFLPYNYSVAWMVTHEGYTQMRALGMDFPSDKNIYPISDEYMFGPALLVSPVTVPNAVSRTVYLPGGTTWYDFWTGLSTKGGQTVTAAAPEQTIPLFVRAGSIIPFGPALQYTSEKPADPLELRVYPGADGAFTLYEDEGDSYNYEKGIYATIPFTWSDEGKTLTIGARQGSFPGMLTTRTFRIVRVRSGKGVGGSNTPTDDKIVSYSGKKLVINL
jgi:alpha-D-xyloside xylohydrolase